MLAYYNNSKEENKFLEIKNIMQGVMISLFLLFFISVLIGFIVSFLNWDSTWAEQTLTFCNYLVILVGGFFTGANVKNKGWLNGGLVGLIHMIFIFLLGIFWLGSAFSLAILVMLIMGIFTGLIGGMLGININK